jgi:hypothetical protein
MKTMRLKTKRFLQPKLTAMNRPSSSTPVGLVAFFAASVAPSPEAQRADESGFNNSLRGRKRTIHKTPSSFNKPLRNSMNRASSSCCSFIILLVACFALLPRTQAACQQGCNNSLFNAFQGDDALINNTTGSGNTAIGWRSLFSNTDASFNTAVGSGALVLNNGSFNTALGAAALLLDTTGGNNTAIGTNAMVFNDTGSSNTALGAFALENNVDGGGNTAVGVIALASHGTGSYNTAIGYQALLLHTSGEGNTALGSGTLQVVATGENNTALGRHAGNAITEGSDNVCVGFDSGTAITTGSGIITIGSVNGVHSIFGEVSDRTYIANVLGAAVDVATAELVYVDADGRLGTFPTAAGPENKRHPKRAVSQTIPDAAAQIMLNRKMEALEATVAELRTQLKEQAEQIQKMTAQIGRRDSTATLVTNDQ